MTDTAFSEEEHDLIRRAAFGAMALVSNADPGFLSMFKESMAGSRALAAAPDGVKSLLKEGGFPSPPMGSSKEEIEGKIVTELGQAVQLLDARAPEQAQGFRDVVLSACDAVANASKGVAPEEQAVIDKVKQAMGQAGAPAPTPGQPPAPGQGAAPAPGAAPVPGPGQTPASAPAAEPQGMSTMPPPAPDATPVTGDQAPPPPQS